MVNHGKSYANNMANGGKQRISGLFDDRRVPSPWGTRLSTSRRPDFAPICGQRPMCHGQRLEILEISQILQKPCQLGSRLCWHRYPLRRASKEAPSFFGIWVNPKSHRYMWYSMIYIYISANLPDAKLWLHQTSWGDYIISQLSHQSPLLMVTAPIYQLVIRKNVQFVPGILCSQLEQRRAPNIFLSRNHRDVAQVTW